MINAVKIQSKARYCYPKGIEKKQTQANIGASIERHGEHVRS